jgi:hypothetical protein
MRSASLVAAAEGVKALLDAKASPVAKRGIVSSVLQRADEPGELLAYWISQYGRNGAQAGQARDQRRDPAALQRVRDAEVRHAEPRASASRTCWRSRMPEPVAPWQADLFGFINARRWGP